jgi:hypothetical protein
MTTDVKSCFIGYEQKLNMIEQQCQDQSCLFAREDHRKKDGHNTEKLFCVQFPVNMISVAR